MRQPNPDEELRTPDDRKPGRSFDAPDRPLGEDTVARARPEDVERSAGVYGRAETREPVNDVGERAKAVATLRKAEEFMATDNPSPRTAEGMRRALELAAGRIGMTLDEYDRIVKRDPELQELERKVLEANAPH